MFRLNLQDLRHILTQVKIAENHVATGQIVDAQGNPIGNLVPYGLRTVSGIYNNLVNIESGSSGNLMPRLLSSSFDAADINPRTGQQTSYAQTSGSVYDSDPRTVSNLVSDQSLGNPAALATALLQTTYPADQITGFSIRFAEEYRTMVAAANGTDPAAAASAEARIAEMQAQVQALGVELVNNTVVIPNIAPDLGNTAPYNGFFTLFGQFFDHGLDLVSKGAVVLSTSPFSPTIHCMCRAAPPTSWC